MTTSENEAIEGELAESPDVITTRRAKGSLDTAYIYNYTQNPKAGKAAALRATGYKAGNVRQSAYRLHQRLRPKINALLRETITDLGSVSAQQLEYILTQDVEDIGIAGMLHAIRLGLAFSGNNPVESDLKDNRTPIVDVQKRITQLTRQIALAKPTDGSE
jgi:hypothetical protein